jgi:uncharacterized protein YjbJ (UPF0337 family)
MNWDTIKGNWKQFIGSAKKQWGRLTDDELTQISGEKDRLVGKLQERYGYAREEAQRHVDEWERSQAEEPVGKKGRIGTVRGGGEPV